MKIDDKMKAYGLGVISTILVILVFIGIMSLFGDFKDKKLDDSIVYKEVYGTVKSYRDGYILVEPIDEELDEEIRVKVDKYYKEGDFILINDDEITLIASSDSLAEVITTTTTTSRTTKDKTVTTKKTSTTKRNTSKTTKKPTTTTTTKVVTTTKKNDANADDTVIAYVRDASTYAEAGNSNDETFGQKVKRYFITVVDFIFYEGEIKGYKWNELTTTAKAKVVYYALLLDTKIDEKFPDYKNTISTKYQDIKAKLVAKYLDLTNNICNKDESNRYHCDVVKQDFELLKESAGVTWDVVVNAFKYAYNKTTEYLKTWYETFSGK